jgi:uncharacterized protein YcbK (DUF882 family)
MTYKQLSPHFSFEELTITNRKYLLEANRLAALNHIEELALLANYILEPARLALNTPLIITSAYRCAQLNKAVGGAAKSQHLFGQAADFVPQGIALKEAFDILRAAQHVRYGQLIYEGKWIHISLGAPFRPRARCGEVLEIL